MHYFLYTLYKDFWKNKCTEKKDKDGGEWDECSAQESIRTGDLSCLPPGSKDWKNAYV